MPSGEGGSSKEAWEVVETLSTVRRNNATYVFRITAVFLKYKWVHSLHAYSSMLVPAIRQEPYKSIFTVDE